MTPHDKLVQQVSEFLERKRNREALKLVREAWAQGTRSVHLKLLEAEACKALLPPDTTGALRAYEEAIALEPDNWRAYNDMGLYLMSEGKRYLQRAVEVLEEARRRAPTQPEPSLNLVLAYARTGRDNESVELAQQILRDLPADHPLHPQATALVEALLAP
ncbi:tetratricopeptide repeat protein [Cystobacter fuscus]|uniref:tetratricopeptide repeat protein n=1 Tax=Cystobacter fuscus TaxID=43 RepID=UPI002B30CC13|nr:tetratricopeptide repeat protein [Cystobacter fuscus]